MLAIVNRGFEARLRDLRERAFVIGLTFEPAERDARCFQESFADGPPERLTAEALAAAPRDRGCGWTLARMLGRDYPRNHGAALDAVVRACGVPGDGDEAGPAQDDRALLVGQAMLDLAFGLARPEDAALGLPLLVPRGFDVASDSVFPSLGRTIVDFLRPVSRDATGLMMCLGMSERLADLVAREGDRENPDAIGGFVAGLLEGMTGKSWDRAASDAIAANELIDAEDYPFIVAGHLCLQMTGPGVDYELPGFGEFPPMIPQE